MQFKSIFFLALIGLSLGTPRRKTDNHGRDSGPPTCSPKIESPSYKKPGECYLDTDEDGEIEDGLLSKYRLIRMYWDRQM